MTSLALVSKSVVSEFGDCDLIQMALHAFVLLLTTARQVGEGSLGGGRAALVSMSPMILTSSAPADPATSRKQVSEATASARMSIVMPCILSCVLPDWPSAFQILIPLRKWLPAIIFRLQAFELLVKGHLGHRGHREPQRRPREMPTALRIASARSSLR